jgi:hypothetical protein
LDEPPAIGDGPVSPESHPKQLTKSIRDALEANGSITRDRLIELVGAGISEERAVTTDETNERAHAKRSGRPLVQERTRQEKIESGRRYLITAALRALWRAGKIERTKVEGIESFTPTNQNHKTPARAPIIEDESGVNDPLLKLATEMAGQPTPTRLDLKGCTITPIGMPPNVTTLRALAMVPWIKINREGNKTVTIHIDEELKAICEGRAPRPEINGWSYRAWFKNLRETIIQRRKENNDARLKKNWSTDQVSKAEQTDLLNWVEKELDKIP